MVKETTVFEGYYDQNPGWEFDMPAYMLKPILGYVEVGSGSAGVDELVEEYFIAKFTSEDENGRANGSNEEFMCQVDEDMIPSMRSQFAYAKKGKARDGIVYWRRVVEWDDTNINYENVLEDVRADRNGVRKA